MKTRFVRVSAALSVSLLVVVPLYGGAEARMPELPPSVRTSLPPEPLPLLTSRVVESDVVENSGVTPAVLELALRAVSCATVTGEIAPPPTLTLIDYSRPSVEPRLWVFDLATGNLLYKELVAHGKNTGENLSLHFSDQMDSHQSSLGLFVTQDTYVGSNGYSLRLDGLEDGFNATARSRAIVMHGAPYVNSEVAARQGRLGRSWGCPAVREAVAREVIDTVRGGGVIFSYYPDREWLQSSRFLNGCGTPVASKALL